MWGAKPPALGEFVVYYFLCKSSSAMLCFSHAGIFIPPPGERRCRGIGENILFSLNKSMSSPANWPSTPNNFSPLRRTVEPVMVVGIVLPSGIELFSRWSRSLRMASMVSLLRGGGHGHLVPIAGAGRSRWETGGSGG
jgi:hypothetical protein